METFYQNLEREHRWARRTVNIKFTNPPHLMDCRVFVRNAGIEAEFAYALFRVASLFVSDASGRPASQAFPPEPDPAIAGRTVNIWFSPDSPTRPSFTWRAEAVPDTPGAKPVMLLHGGLIYRDNAEWTIHT